MKPFYNIGGRLVCAGPLLKADDHGTGGNPSKLTEEEFRAKMLGFADDIGKKSKATETELADVKEFKQKAEALFSDRDKARDDIDTLTTKIVELQRTAGAVRSQRDPNESDREYFKRAFPEECKALGEAVKAKNAGYTVQRAESTSTLAPGQAVQFDSAIYSRVSAYGAFRNLDVHPMGAATENMIVETGEPDFVFVAENGEIPEVALGIGTVGATAKKIGGIIRVSNEVLQDSIFDLGAYVAEKFARAAARRADYVAFLGTGANDPNNGGFTGIVAAGTVTSAAATHTSVSTMTYTEVSSFMYSLGQAVLEGMPKWFMNPVSLARFMGIRDGNGRPIFLNAMEAPAYGAIGTLLGFPVVPVSVLPATDAAGGVAAIFGDPMAYAVGIRKDYTFDFSDHAGFTAAQRVYRGYMRGAWKIKDATKLGVLKTAAA